MKNLITILAFTTFFLASAFPQKDNHAVPALTVINHLLTAHRYEFSALAKWKDKILLIPQDCKNVIDSIFMIDSTEIEKVLSRQDTTAAYSSFAIKNIRHAVENHSRVLYIGDVRIENYDGFEAAVVKKDTIFFTVEGETSFCYLIKGLIDADKKTVTLLEDTLQLPDTYGNIDNAGYESIAWLPGKDSLVCFFECNKDTVNAKALGCGSGLKKPLKPVRWSTPLYFRLTDTYAINDSEMIGINHLFINKTYPRERDEYIECEKLSNVENQLNNGGNIDSCFTQIIKLLLTNGKLRWQPLAFISLNCRDNYEGIVAFKNGALMIVDGEPGLNEGKLIYVSLK